MMRLPGFRYEIPGTIEEAASVLANEEGVTRLVAGGTDLWPNMKRRHQGADTVVSLRRISSMRGIEKQDDGSVVIGAMTTLTDICRSRLLRELHPGLVRAVASISAPVLRNMGTIGGNLCLDTRCTYYNQNEEWRRSIDYCMKEVGEVCWVAPGSSRCWAIQASDSAPLLCAIGARVRLVSVAGERVITAAELYNDDGIVYLTKKPDEILTEVILPPAGGFLSTYWKLRRRDSIDFPVLGVGAMVSLDEGGVVNSAEIYLGAVASFPTPAEEASSLLVGRALDEDVIAQAAAAARGPATPMDNTDFVVNWRKQMVERYVDGALRELAGLEPKVRVPSHGMWVA